MLRHLLREKWAEPRGTKAEDPAKYTTAPIRSLQREMVGTCHLKKYKFMGPEFSKLKTKSLAVLPEIALLDRGLQDGEGAGGRTCSPPWEMPEAEGNPFHVNQRTSHGRPI